MIPGDFKGVPWRFQRSFIHISGKFMIISRGFREALEEFRDVQNDFRIDSWGFRGFEWEET